MNCLQTKVVYIQHGRTLAMLSKRIDTNQQARIEFAARILKHQLLDIVRVDDVFYHQYGISERTFDTCFEMNDADAIVVAIMRQAESDKALVAGIKSQLGEGCYQHWCSVYHCHQEHEVNRV